MSAKQWANSLCSALQDFGDSAHSTLDGLKSASSLDRAVQQAEQGLPGAVNDLEKSLDGLGKPPTPNAKKAQSAVQNLGKELQSDVDDIQA